jgi:hypothetical protein
MSEKIPPIDQIDRFKELGCELGCDEDEARFDEALTNLAESALLPKLDPISVGLSPDAPFLWLFATLAPIAYAGFVMLERIAVTVNGFACCGFCGGLDQNLYGVSPWRRARCTYVVRDSARRQMNKQG